MSERLRLKIIRHANQKLNCISTQNQRQHHSNRQLNFNLIITLLLCHVSRVALLMFDCIFEHLRYSPRAWDHFTDHGRMHRAVDSARNAIRAYRHMRRKRLQDISLLQIPRETDPRTAIARRFRSSKILRFRLHLPDRSIRRLPFGYNLPTKSGTKLPAATGDQEKAHSSKHKCKSTAKTGIFTLTPFIYFKCHANPFNFFLLKLNYTTGKQTGQGGIEPPTFGFGDRRSAN